MNGYFYYLHNIQQIFKSKKFQGWGRKKTGCFAVWCSQKFGGTFTLYEDGFIRSIDLGVEGSPSFSIVEDDVGLYYDATTPSKLENILNTYDFASDVKLMIDAKKAIKLLVEHNISKYNSASEIDDRFRIKYGMTGDENSEKKVLVIAQTAGDTSLEYGMLNDYTTEDMLNAALSENPDAKVYLKIHPDVLSGKKKSDIDIVTAKEKCIIIEENVNPISLLKHFSKVYTKTSGMGFEALLVGCECVCFGMPFYAGWGVTQDRSICTRRVPKRSIEEIFAAAYILYTRYYNPYEKRDSDIFDTIAEIIQQRKMV